MQLCFESKDYPWPLVLEGSVLKDIQNSFGGPDFFIGNGRIVVSSRGSLLSVQKVIFGRCFSRQKDWLRSSSLVSIVKEELDSQLFCFLLHLWPMVFL